MTQPYPLAPPPPTQAITTCLLSHAVSLAHLNTIFRMVRAARYPRGGVVMGSMDGMALKSVDGP